MTGKEFVNGIPKDAFDFHVVQIDLSKGKRDIDRQFAELHADDWHSIGTRHHIGTNVVTVFWVRLKKGETPFRPEGYQFAWVADAGFPKTQGMFEDWTPLHIKRYVSFDMNVLFDVENGHDICVAFFCKEPN